MHLVIVPTAHVFKKSVVKVRETIMTENPDIIALELCPARFRALLSKKKPTFRQLISSPTYAFLYLLQQLLGFVFGSAPGNEMLEGIKAASELNKPLLLADRNIQTTMGRIRKIPLSEKVRMLLGLLPSPFSLKVAGKAGQLTDHNFLLPFLKEFDRKFPKAYAYLVTERNEHMFHSLLHHPEKKIVLVVGAGHVPGLLDLIKEHNLKEGDKITYVVK